MTPEPGVEPGPHWWEVSVLTTATPLRLIPAVKDVASQFPMSETLMYVGQIISKLFQIAA